MTTPVERYRRLRHSRGFGVHSPWAYGLVREALMPLRGYGYYCRGAVDKLFGNDSRTAMLTLRVLLYARASRVDVESLDGRWFQLARLAEGGTGRPALIVTDGRCFPTFLGDPAEALPYETIVMTCLDTADGRSVWLSLVQAMLSAGHGYAVDTHRRLGIMSLRRDMPGAILHLKSLKNDQ